jgi:hypothetical protein
MVAFDDVITHVLSVIVIYLTSFKSLNKLMRTNRQLRLVASDPMLFSIIVTNIPDMDKNMLCKLFVLPTRMYISRSPMAYNTKRYSAAEGFRHAVVLHGGVNGIRFAHQRRIKRGNAMKLVWIQRKADTLRRWEGRRRDLDTIMRDLRINPSIHNTTTRAEIYYQEYGVVQPMNSVYRSKRLMKIFDAGLLQIGTTFTYVANIDRTMREMLTHSESMYVLMQNIAWEHYLLNFSNFLKILADNHIQDIQHVEVLFPLPTQWPWVVATPRCVVHVTYEDIEVDHGGFEVVE